tara:strand:- start:44 stop:562 length:519 start_codon:yes stop_codon:yes gene_type:complete
MKVYDDFLSPKDFRFVQLNMLGTQFPWSQGTVMNPEVDELLCDEIDNIQFSNWMYRDFEPKGPEFAIAQPIISDPRLEICSIHRIKANLTLRTSEVVQHGFHRDGTGSFMVAIYYVNSNDGYTEFEDGSRIETIENRLLVFDSSLWHTGSTCTNAKVRCVINFNYFPEKYGA